MTKITPEILAKYPPLSSYKLSFSRVLPKLDTLRVVLEEAQHPQQVTQALARFCQDNGIKMIGHLAVLPTGIQEQLAWFETSKMARFTEQYLDQGGPDIDPAAQRARHEILPIPWGLQEQRKRPQDIEKQIYGVLDTFSLSRGLIVPIHGPGCFSVLGVTVGDSDNDLKKRLPELGVSLQLVANYTHDAITRLFWNTTQESLITLTPREKECLCWSAAGYSAYKIGHRLNISESTAQFHLQNVRRKLSAKTLVQAVAIAMRKKLIEP